MAMASTLVQPLYCSTPAFQSALTRSPAAPSTSSKLTSWNVKRTSAFFGDSFYTRFAFRGAVKWRVAEERSMRRKAVGVVQAKRMESSADVATRAPDFQLVEPLTGDTWELEDFEAFPALLVMFICNHCPFVIHLKKDLVKLANSYQPRGLQIVAISSNSVVTHPQDGPEFMAEDAKTLRYPFPYLYDETQEVAKAYGAVCTPEFFLYKKEGPRPFELVYHGQYDDSRPGNDIPVTGRDIREAIECVLSGRRISFPQRPSIGCSIKWAPGSNT
ncbi:uncharacterized protein [Physcomitrium patens]|uniref:Thioredoxin domain-containing protein n=1 Tax=Physcomitrium patens TaxID=3218 RepID=A0A2K1IW59_PHYPA|nr:uncharacterized protein LOC112273061 [Physcomitrium patens]PNR33510.1 hypothetical protein PHYPA_025454 [Physcomitrium patens]|eukprot:XP_024357173.1 uncharacterized protein LOC112273061 [Physcomitrella patens]